ncbi:MAG: hypothetical protein FWF80_05885 [Defluviitaleaceae bacterium]|nr:hypothetical protein [Defluviitaleaceae bacterium]
MGGIVGRAVNTVITDSYSHANVTGRRRVGGIVGVANNSIIECCFSTGHIHAFIGSTNTQFSANAGGIAGIAENSTVIRDSFSTGSVDAFHAHIGGIAGRAVASRITNNYSPQLLPITTP